MSNGNIEPLTRDEFERFRELIHREAGIAMGPSKQALVLSRLLPRLRALGIHSFGEYYCRALGDPQERTACIERLCTSETHFFREPHQFELLERRMVPEWVAAADAGRQPRALRIWSAGCASGEEPYSIAMCLKAALGDRWSLDILATDLSTRNLRIAEEGVWPIGKAEEIPLPLLKRFMLRGTGTQEGKMAVSDELRALVKFAQVNLHAPPYAVSGPFDALFCRNVLIYFDAASKEQVARALIEHLAPGGIFLLGHAETLLGLDLRLRLLAPTVYGREDPSANR